MSITLHHTEADATQAYAQACWQNDPLISPTYWREGVLGTVGKVWVTGEQARALPELLLHGVNGVVSGVNDALDVLPDGVVQVLRLTVAEVRAGRTLPPAQAWVLGVDKAEDEAALLAAMEVCEQAVKDGVVQAWGVASAALGQAAPVWPLTRLLALGSVAAERVWGRRKRSGLRVVLAPLGLADVGLLTNANCAHANHTDKQGMVSALELAARLGLLVIAEPVGLPDFAPAVQGMTALAEAELALHRALQGWPMTNEGPVWSAMGPLQAGLAPWPTVQSWRIWRDTVHPALLALWDEVVVPDAAAPERASYVAGLREIPAWGHLAALMGALRDFPGFLGEQWGTANPWVQQVGVLSSIPGVSGVLMADVTMPDLTAWQRLGDWPDPAGALAGFLA
jgi:hypothetical protein